MTVVKSFTVKVPDPAKEAIKAIQTRRRQIPDLLDEESWRGFLSLVTGGVNSLRAMNDRQRTLVLDALAKRGAKTVAGRTKLADDPQSRKLRAMWINLHQAGAVQSRSEKALAAWCGRQLGGTVDDLRFVVSGDKHHLIEALKGWCQRVGLAVE